MPRVLGELSDRFDRALQDLNPSYREMRMGDWVYAAPIAERRSVADFEEYRRRNLDRGQFKPKRLLKSEALARAEFGESAVTTPTGRGDSRGSTGPSYRRRELARRALISRLDRRSRGTIR